MNRFAAKTTVAPEKSRADIETLLRRYGADQFVSGWGAGKAMIGFRAKNRLVRFELPLPELKDEVFWRDGRSSWRRRSESAATAAWEQESRRRWRALALVIKAKLEAVESGITSFETEFLAHIVLPGGQTVGQHIAPRIEEAYSTGRVPLLLPESTP